MPKKTNRFFIKYSSMFDSRKYDVNQMIKHLGGMIVNPRLSYAYGWNNQPKVLTFRCAQGVTIRAISEELSKLYNGKRPLIEEKYW